MANAATMTDRRTKYKSAFWFISLSVGAIALCILALKFIGSDEMLKFQQFGYIGVFLIALLSSFSIVLPIPGTAAIIGAAAIWNPLMVAFIASIGATLGEITGYQLGYSGRTLLAQEESESYQSAKKWMEKHGGFAIFLFALVPFLIFDFLGIAAGALKYPLKKFFLFAWLGRLPRSILECYVGASLLEIAIKYFFR